MKQVKRITMLVAAVALAVGALAPLAFAGNNDGQTPVPPSSVFGPQAAAVPSDITVALFFDPAYNDVDTDGGGEAYNLQQTLLNQGFDVQTFVGITTADWTTALAGADVLAISELQGGNLVADLEPGALAAVQAFVNGGGRLIATDSSDFDFLDAVIGSGTLSGSAECPCSKTPEADGTEFADGPASILDNSAVGTLDMATAPAGSVMIYEDDDAADEAGVAIIPLGSGTIVYLGWDWFFGETDPANFTDWFEVLNAAVLAVAPAPAPTPAPEPVVVVPAFTG